MIQVSGKELKRRADARLEKELEELEETFKNLALPSSSFIFICDETGSQTSSSIKRSIRRSATSQIPRRGSDDGWSFTLIMDGHGSRLSDEFTQFAEGN